MVTRSPRAEHKAVWDIATGIAVNRGQEVNAPFVPKPSGCCACSSRN